MAISALICFKRLRETTIDQSLSSLPDSRVDELRVSVQVFPGSVQEFMTDVEVRAAHNVLEACAQTETIDKVVFTSSATAVIWRDDRKSITGDLDERHWSDINFCRKFKLWHALSKTLAEKTAWALAMDRGVNMAHICIYEDVSAYGRYLCFNHVINRHEDAMKLASMLTPSAPSLPQSVDQDLRIIQQGISSKKLNKLMVDFESSPLLEN
ncbi:hypothetical protein OIU77_027399 [Salix suchowensis]|uniref:3-beta hydroxysteroid dehydrogenase/isomerase domain-containing protein n=1 Tax=Salix suchowensis TaxID=1278906 RepID=A0ABQ9BPH9_9ROSI|nr:hypothetical protein OIU77_027399 [Salix suchowensis]